MDKFLGQGFYHVRLTVDISLEDVETFIKKHSDKYLISFELTHYHCLCYLKGDPTRKKPPSDFRVSLKDCLNLEGNKSYSISPCRNKNQLMKYTLKDDVQYVYSGFDDQIIEQMKKLSFKKGKSNFANELTQLEDNYISDKNMEISSFAEKLVKLKVSYNHNLYSSHLKAYLKKMEIKKHGHKAIRSYVEDLLQHF